MEEIKLEVEHFDGAVEANDLGQDSENFYQPEWKYAKYIPGGYSPARCLKLEGKPMIYAILALAGCAIMFFGYDASVMSLVNTNQNYLHLMGTDSGSKRDSAAIGGLVSVWFGGFGIGAILVGLAADKIGRLKTIQLGCIWAIIGALLQSTAQSLPMMLVARIIGGIGCGHLNTIVPIWTSELADPHFRGAFVAVEFTLAILGSTLVYWMEYACTKLDSPEFAWRFPLAFQIVFLLAILGAIVWYPESPRFLMMIGREADARVVLGRCRVDGDAVRVEGEMREIREAIILESKSTSRSFGEMLFVGDELCTRRRVLLGCGVQVMQKLTGIDFIATYAPEMFTLAGFSGNKPALLAGGNYFGYAASLAVSIYFADRFGRRANMMVGSLLMGIVLIVGGVLAHFVLRDANGNPDEAQRLGAGVATVLYLYTFIYGSTWLTTCWVYPTEIFPLASRAKGVALATVAFSLAGGVINEIVPYLINAIGFWVFILFALINFAMIVPIWLFYIETAHRHLEDLDLLFAGKSNLSWRAEREFASMKSRETDALEGESQEKSETL